MKKKSKFLVFMLSLIPGLSHLYVGFKERALIFFVTFFGAILGVVGLAAITNSEDFFVLLAIGLPVIWFVALVDAIMSCDRLNEQKEEGQDSMGNINRSAINANRKMITVALSMIPGAGHMFLGFQRKGLELMSLFFFTTYLMGWLNMSLFFFFLPVIWFYSIFDAYHSVEGDKECQPEDNVSILSWIQERPKFIGWGLVVLGGFIILERNVSPLINYQIRQFLQTGVVALILIGVGIKLIVGSKKNREVVSECDNVE